MREKGLRLGSKTDWVVKAYFLVNNIRMPCLGRKVISGFNATF